MRHNVVALDMPTGSRGTPARILITGSRVWTNTAMMRNALTRGISLVAEAGTPITIVHGAAHGADELAAALAPTLGPHVTSEPWPADWNGPCRATCRPGHRKVRQNGTEYCPAAGAYRNQAMVDAGAALVLGFPMNESPGTRDCLARAAAAGIRVIDVPSVTCAPLYSSRNRAARHAWLIADRAGTKPVPPEYCRHCNGWHLAGAVARTAA